MYQFKFADIGEGLHEGKVVKIHVNVGLNVKEGDVLFEVETDKVTSEITSPVSGTITEIKVKVDDVVHVGDVVFLIDDQSSKKLVSTPQAAAKESGDGGASVVGEVKVSDDLLDFNFAKPTSQPSSKPAVSHLNEPLKMVPVPKNLKISPMLRRYAAMHKIDLTKVVPTGANKVVKQVDLDLVLNLEKPTAPIASVSIASTDELKVTTGFIARREKTSPMRQAIAKNLKTSWENVAYTNLVVQADVSELWELRNTIKEPLFKTTGTKITFLPYIAKAVTIALQDFPIFTAQYDEKTQELVYPNTINLGIAVDTEHGLMVPNIKNAQTKSVLVLANEINDLATKARNRKLGGTEMTQGTFTITNYGSAGALFGVPVIKYPEMAILGVGTIIEQVQRVAVGSTAGVRKLMYLTVAADHRWVDGAAVGRFATRIKQLLENPSLLSVY